MKQKTESQRVVPLRFSKAPNARRPSEKLRLAIEICMICFLESYEETKYCWISDGSCVSILKLASVSSVRH